MLQQKIYKFKFLSIAGSDNSGGAGVQMDIKIATLLGGYGMCAINDDALYYVRVFPTSYYAAPGLCQSPKRLAISATP